MNGMPLAALPAAFPNAIRCVVCGDPIARSVLDDCWVHLRAFGGVGEPHAAKAHWGERQ